MIEPLLHAVQQKIMLLRERLRLLNRMRRPVAEELAGSVETNTDPPLEKPSVL